jgi:Spy/CpxP family protein refolding chaperone
MKKLMMVPVVVVLLFAWLGSSDAMMCDKCMGKGAAMAGEHPMLGKLKALGLDEKQMGEVKAIHFRVMKEVIKKKADLQVARVEMKEILGQEPVDLKAAEAKIRQIEALRGDMKIMHIKAREEVKSKLTPEQKKKFEAMMATMPMMHGGMMGKMNGKCGMKGKMKKCKKCGMMGGGMMDPDDDDDMFSGPADEMPAMGHQQMHHGK